MVCLFDRIRLVDNAWKNAYCCSISIDGLKIAPLINLARCLRYVLSPFTETTDGTPEEPSTSREVNWFASI